MPTTLEGMGPFDLGEAEELTPADKSTAADRMLKIGAQAILGALFEILIEIDTSPMVADAVCERVKLRSGIGLI